MQLPFIIWCSFLFFSSGIEAQTPEKIAAFANKELDDAFLKYTDRIEAFKQDGDSLQLAKGHWDLGEFYFNIGVSSEAMSEFNVAAEIIEEYAIDSLLIHIKNSQGLVELSLKNYKEAEAYFNEAILLSNKTGYTRGLAITNGLLGSCFEKKQQYKKALEYQKESLSLFEKLQDRNGLSLVNENIGSIYEDLEQYSTALQYFEKAHVYLKGTGNNYEANILNNLGDVYRKTNRYKEGILFTEKALEIAIRVKDNHQIESAYKDLSKGYEALGKYKEAFTFLQASGKINTELFFAQNTNQINVLQTVYENSKQESQIKLLQEERKVEKANHLVVIVAISAMFILVILIGFFITKKRKQQLKTKIYEQKILKAELEKGILQEESLQNEIQLKTAALSTYSLHLSQKNKILVDVSNTLTNLIGRKNMDIAKKIKDLVKDIHGNIKHDQEWEEFTFFFRDIHPNFISKLSVISHESLSPAELRLAMLLRLNLSSKEIASIIRVTPDSVRVARYRLRKKLTIDPKEELVNFLISL